MLPEADVGRAVDSLLDPWLCYGDAPSVMQEAIVQGFIQLKLLGGPHLEPSKTREITKIPGVCHIRRVESLRS